MRRKNTQPTSRASLSRTTAPNTSEGIGASAFVSLETMTTLMASAEVLV